MLRPLTLAMVTTTLLTTLVAPSQGKVYRWVDGDGTTHFSDTPIPEAQELEVEITPPVGEGPMVQPRTPLNKKTTLEAVTYELQITSPSDEGTVRNNNGDLKIITNITPDRPSKARYRLFLDGVPQGQLQEAPVFFLTNIDRGAHTLKVQLVDQTGKEIASSEMITVYMHRKTA